MNWSNAMSAGFLSAAIARADADLAASRPGVAAVLHDVLERAMPPASARRDALPGLVAMLARALPDPAHVPVRARALVAMHFPRDVARAWLVGVPMPRPGFRAHPAFVAWLRSAVMRSEVR